MNVMGKKMCVCGVETTKLAASVFAVSIAFAFSSCLLLICLCYIVVFKSGWGYNPFVIFYLFIRKGAFKM